MAQNPKSAFAWTNGAFIQTRFSALHAANQRPLQRLAGGAAMIENGGQTVTAKKACESSKAFQRDA
jgi:hypothetical protein